jgi:hypothetical protein
MNFQQVRDAIAENPAILSVIATEYTKEVSAELQNRGIVVRTKEEDELFVNKAIADKIPVRFAEGMAKEINQVLDEKRNALEGLPKFTDLEQINSHLVEKGLKWGSTDFQKEFLKLAEENKLDGAWKPKTYGGF